MFYVITLVTIAAMVAAVAAAYHAAPFKPLPETRPRFAWYPKYRFRVEDLADLDARVTRLGFKLRPDLGVNLRGFALGDFSGSSLRLKLRVDPATGEAELGSAMFGVLFDTGGVWRVAKMIIDGAEDDSGGPRGRARVDG